MKHALFVFIGIVLCMSCSVRAFAQPSKPNIVYILTDQWRASALGYAGDPNVITPNLDQFAEESVNFANAVSVLPVCTPHRAALMTGRYPTSTGMFLNDLYLPEEELCMAEIFKEEGYNTAYYGKWHLDGHGRENNVEVARRQGFDYWKALECSHDYNHMPYYENDDPRKKYWEEYSPFAIANDAGHYIDHQSREEEPFLLVLSIATPHFPHHSAPEEFKNMYPREEIILAPNVPEEFREKALDELQGYYAHCTATDRAIGQVLDKLKAVGLMENTIVVFSADHGELMGAHGIRPFTKQLAWDESINVPFLIHYPSIGQAKGAVVNAPINTPDILPSLLGLAGIPIPESIEGEDMSQLMKSPDPEVEGAALVMNLCPFTREYKFPEYRAVRTNRYTYVKTLEGPAMLFDNENDPYQMDNLVDKAHIAELQKDLDQELHRLLTKINDDFHPREYYLKRWNLELDPSKYAINYWQFDSGEGRVQSPKFQ
ncbi:sulfatase [Echinicola pacifica]|uniref:Sulfatase n=1 Tax=Echinicola pacifica TaxID=346377 RepID=A0A918PWW8_9BACT|nr:sulfatase [Echinicola pacifica]GGZ25624.1 sulfatase [Echinicola pacifica]